MSNIPKPFIPEAPGLVWRPRKGGWVATWQARTDLVKEGYSPQTARLWAGVEPSETDRMHIVQQCRRLQADMLVWSKDQSPRLNVFDGTMRSLINCYQTDPDSTYHKKRYAVRRNHDTLLRRIAERHGDELLQNIKARLLIAWHKEWGDDGRMLATAHAIIGQFRVLFGFGATLLEDPECERLCSVMSKMRFPLPKPRGERMTADQAIAIRTTAREHFGWGSIGLGQALQFELMLRQKDVIGEWVPVSEPGVSDIHHEGQKWILGVRWSEIDDNFILKHVTSKRSKEIEVNLRLAPMVIEELALWAGVSADAITRDMLPRQGAVMTNEISGLPWKTAEYRRKWRLVADKAGVPKKVLNMDSRAGGITEASDAGANMEHIRHAATHSDIAMTQKYSRGSVEKIANVMQLRLEHRNKSKTGNENG